MPKSSISYMLLYEYVFTLNKMFSHAMTLWF